MRDVVIEADAASSSAEDEIEFRAPYNDEANDYLRGRGWESRRSDTDRDCYNDYWEWPPTQKHPWRSPSWIQFTGEVFQIWRADHEGFFSTEAFHNEATSVLELATLIDAAETWPLTRAEAQREIAGHRVRHRWAEENNLAQRAFPISEPFATRINLARQQARAGLRAQAEATRTMTALHEQAWLAYACATFASSSEGIQRLQHMSSQPLERG